MNEIEVKAKVSSFEEIQSKLTNLGCTFSERLIQKDRIYLPDGIEFPDKTIWRSFLKKSSRAMMLDTLSQVRMASLWFMMGMFQDHNTCLLAKVDRTVAQRRQQALIF